MVTAIRGSLQAKIERLIQRPLIARIGEGTAESRQARARDALFDLFGELDYDDLWRGSERDVLDD
ncbi:MAG: hypothetical protein GXP62_16450, partial [Oligoflexia bacterium]|nr:hypothetical protein [Oligoflexia bacterium]